MLCVLWTSSISYKEFQIGIIRWKASPIIKTSLRHDIQIQQEKATRDPLNMILDAKSYEMKYPTLLDLLSKTLMAESPVWIPEYFMHWINVTYSINPLPLLIPISPKQNETTFPSLLNLCYKRNSSLEQFSK